MISRSLECQNPLWRDGDVELIESTHQYIIRGNCSESKDYKSVTQFIKQQFVEFNSEKVADQILQSEHMQTESYQYYGYNKADILNYWKDCAAQGTKLHADIELYYNNQTNQIVNTSIEFKYFLNFAKDHNYLTPFRTEIKIYCTQIKIAGSVDMLYKLDNGHYLIADWKRSKHIHTGNNCHSENNCTAAGMEHLSNTNYNHYCLQLNMYRHILEQEYNMLIDGMFFVVFHPNNLSNNYELYPVPRLHAEINKFIDIRKAELLNLLI